MFTDDFAGRVLRDDLEQYGCFSLAKQKNNRNRRVASEHFKTNKRTMNEKNETKRNEKTEGKNTETKRTKKKNYDDDDNDSKREKKFELNIKNKKTGTAT